MPRGVRTSTLVRAPAPKRPPRATAGPLLVATDFSPASRRAFDAAAALARDLGVGLVLVHATAALDAAARGKRGSRPSGPAAERDLAALADAARDLGVRASLVTQTGDPADVILQAARDGACSAIVLAASGKGLLRTLLVGSTAREVLRRSRLPVLVLPTRVPPAAGQAREPSRTIAVGLDLSAPSEAAYEAGLRLARDLKATLRLVHVVELPMPVTALPYADAAFPPDLLDRMEQEGAAALVHQAAKARAHQVGVVPVQHVGPAASALLADARASGASLIVVGSHGRSRARGFFLGSVAHTLVQLADRPVLVVPDPRERQDAGEWTR